MTNPEQRHPARRAARVVLAPLLALLLAGTASAHQRLERSAPAEGARLDEVPRALRLVFAQPVGLALTRIELVDAGGESVELAEPALAGDPASVVVEVEGRLLAGEYVVRWRTVGPDGHPVQGAFGFVIAEGAAGLAPSGPVGTAPPAVESAGTDAVAGPVPGAVDGGAFDAGSPAYVAIRWFTFLCIMGLVGSVAFRVGVLPLALHRGGSAARALAAPAAAGARALGLAVAVVLVPATLLRLLAQAHALGGVNASVLRSLLGGTAWGWGWTLQAVATVAAVLGLWWAHRDERAGWGLATISAVALAFTPALSGHAIAVPGAVPLAVVTDALHVFGAGGWLGTLAVLVAAGIPASLRLQAELRGPAAVALVNAFSPTALLFAGLVVTTGIYASWLHLGGFDALFGTGYGRTLLLKLAALSLVFGAGAYNFMRVRPALGDEAGPDRLRRSSLVELAVGVVVLVVTAVLVATPPAAQSGGAGVLTGSAAPEATTSLR